MTAGTGSSGNCFIAYDNYRRISTLQIKNNKTGRIVYTFGKAAGQEPRNTAGDSVKCAMCGNPILDYVTSKGTKKAADIINWTAENLGAPTCMTCYLKQNKAA